MQEQVKELKSNLMSMDALITGNAKRVPEELRESLLAHTRQCLAIIVAAEALEGTTLERRAFMLDAPVSDQLQRTGTDHVWYRPSNAKYHFSTEDEQIDPTEYDSVAAAKAGLDAYVAKFLNPAPTSEQAAAATDSTATGTTTEQPAEGTTAPQDAPQAPPQDQPQA